MTREDGVKFGSELREFLVGAVVGFFGFALPEKVSRAVGATPQYRVHVGAIATGQGIPAIKALRAVAGLSLKDAKEQVVDHKLVFAAGASLAECQKVARALSAVGVDTTIDPL